MRRLLAAAALALGVLLLSTATAATSSFYADIEAATGIHRTVDASLVALAQKRAIEITTDFSHDGWPGTTDEVIAWNSGYTDPVQAAVNGWMASPDHRAILTDATQNHIGCAGTYSSGRFYAVCELIHATGPTPTATPRPTAAPVPSTGTPQEHGPVVVPPSFLPNTATR